MPKNQPAVIPVNKIKRLTIAKSSKEFKVPTAANFPICSIGCQKRLKNLKIPKANGANKVKPTKLPITIKGVKENPMLFNGSKNKAPTAKPIAVTK